MRHFRTAMIATVVALVVVTLLSLGGMVYIMKTGGGDKRAELLGQAMGMLFGISIAPFWIFGASNLGKERAAALKKAKSKATKSSRKPQD